MAASPVGLRRLVLLASASCLWAAAGCGGEQEEGGKYAGAVLGRSVRNRPVVVERFGASGPVALLFHAIHGDEVPAEQCGERMRSWLLTHPDAWADLQIAFITQANPDGTVLGTRFNANGIDLNRNFPATNFEPSSTFGPSPASEPETQVVVGIVEDSSPQVIVTVHSPLEVINYDGPAQELAEAASEATGIPVELDLGPYPGSFGSWAGLDLQIPTVTLELPDSVDTRAGHDKWLEVEETALAWITGKPGNGVSLTGMVADHDDGDGYEVIVMGESPGERPLVTEQFGTAGKPVLVAAGLDGSDMAVFAGERLRSILLGRLGQAEPLRRILLVTVANPDGVAAGRPQDDDGLHPDKSFAEGFVAGGDAGAEPFQCAEAAAIRDLIESHAVAGVVVVLGGEDQLLVGLDGDAPAMLDAADEGLYGPHGTLGSGRPGSLAAWAAGQGVPALTVVIPGTPEITDRLRADNVGDVLLAVAEAAP